jgi:hypothetical protein
VDANLIIIEVRSSLFLRVRLDHVARHIVSPAGYRKPKARLHNQTKNVKINPSPPLGGALVSYLRIRGENLSKVVVSNENEN